MIGSRVGKIELPAPTHSKTPRGDIKPWVTVRERIGKAAREASDHRASPDADLLLR